MLVYQTKYRSQSAKWVLLVLTSIFIRISDFFWRIYGGKNSAADSASRFFFGWYSADKNSAANSDIRRRLGGLSDDSDERRGETQVLQVPLGPYLIRKCLNVITIFNYFLIKNG